jgi:hypothetical protein
MSSLNTIINSSTEKANINDLRMKVANIRDIIKQTEKSSNNIATQTSRVSQETRPKMFIPLTADQKFAKSKAFELAQLQMIEECVSVFKPNIILEIKTNIEFIKNYRKNVYMLITDDDLVIEFEGEKYIFSRKQFLSNKPFQYKVRERFATFLPFVWIRFYTGRIEDTFCFNCMAKVDNPKQN